MNQSRSHLFAAGLIAGVIFSPITFAQPEGASIPAGVSAGSASAPSPAALTEGAPQQAPLPMEKRYALQMQSLEQQLQPSPEQQSAWSAFRKAQNSYQVDMTKSYRDAPARDASAVAQLEHQVQAAEQDLGSLKALAKATGELYSILDPAQQKVLDDFITKQLARPKASGAPGARDRGGRSRRLIPTPESPSPAH